MMLESSGKFGTFPADTMAQTAPISVVILTRNEETNIAACLKSCAWSDDVHVLDSGSSDRTSEIARQMGASVHVHPFASFGVQRNWAIDNIPYTYDWVFHLDADERFTPELVEEMYRKIAAGPSVDGFYVSHKLIFEGRWLKFSEGFPIYQMRLFHTGRMRFQDCGHGQREDTQGRIGTLREPYLHFNASKGISEWLERHNRYSDLEARAIVAGLPAGGPAVRGSLFGGAVDRRRFLKARVYPMMPAKWLWRFVYMYILKMGILDGFAGLEYCLMMGAYELFTELKVTELRRGIGKSARQNAPPNGSIARPPARYEAAGSNGARPKVLDNTNRDELANQRNTSPWTLKEKLGRVVWMFASTLLFRPSFHNWYGWRRLVLRSFGAKIGRGVRLRPSVHIEIPWNLEIGDFAAVGDDAILYSLGRITIGPMAVVSQYAHLCAGTHDYNDPAFPLLRPPITIGQGSWIAADAFVGPGVTVGTRSVVGARATVVRDVPDGQVVVGNPARVVKSIEQREEWPVHQRSA